MYSCDACWVLFCNKLNYSGVNLVYKPRKKMSKLIVPWVAKATKTIDMIKQSYFSAVSCYTFFSLFFFHNLQSTQCHAIRSTNNIPSLYILSILCIYGYYLQLFLVIPSSIPLPFFWRKKLKLFRLWPQFSIQQQMSLFLISL